MTHTPGPWKIVPHMGFKEITGNSETHDDEDQMGIVGADGSRVLWLGNSTNYYPTEGDEPNQYDARLIAAAPDLLEALIHARNQIQHPDQLIDKAIAKATADE